MSGAQPRDLSQLAFNYGLKPFGIALAFVLVALLWTFLLQHWIDYPFVFLFFGAIMGSAWFGGRTSGLIAVVLSAVWGLYGAIYFSRNSKKKGKDTLLLAKPA